MYAPHEFYHVYNRGVGRQCIFTHDRNYIFLLRRAKRYLPDYDLRIIAYCLMPNHYHFLLCPGDEHAVPRFLQRLFSSYTQAFNLQERRSGTLFQGRPRKVLVDSDGYLLHVCRYIHRNPLEAGLVEKLSDWPYSNYLEWIGAREGSLIDREFVEAHFPTAGDYERFVLDDVDEAVEKRVLAYCVDGQ